jgi:hypothetical protein
LKLASLVLIPAFLLSCKDEAPVEEQVHPVAGEVQILNSSGLPKVAGRVREMLMAKGFDVIEVGNGSSWNYEETIIALRNPHWPGKDALAKALQTENVIPLENPLRMVDATIYIGKDITKVLEHEQP